MRFVTFLTLRTAFPVLLLTSLLSAQTLTFSDDFNGNDLDLTKWIPHEPTISVPANVTVHDGLLHIDGGTATTFGIFAQTYGRFEIRCRIRGMHAGMRLLPVSLGLPSIDVFEADGSAPSKIYFANHWGTEQTERSFGDSFPTPDLSAAFHVIAIEWDRDKIAWFVDGKPRFESVDGVPRQPMFLSLSGSLDIDYIRVYQRR